MSSSLGSLYRIHSFGESHGEAIGVIIDGCPAGITIDLENIQMQLQRRRPGQNRLTTQRKESDELELLSGVYEGKTLGTPIAIIVKNTEKRSQDYSKWGHIYRPSHADYTYHSKYAYRTPHGGGRASVRESIARVAGGALAAQILQEELGIQTIAWVDSIGEIEAGLIATPPVAGQQSLQDIETSLVRCPDEKVSAVMIELIDKVRKQGDSLGGTIGLVVHNVPPGLGEPVFDKLEAELGKALLSIGACKGFESGSGFGGTRMRGSEHNDLFYLPAKEKERERDSVPYLQTHSNYSGGIQGGISNGMPIVARAAFKPTATIFHAQQSVNETGQTEMLKATGRHDPCVLPRAVPIVEAMVNLVLMDAYLQQRARNPEWWLRYRKALLYK